jgi:hypothetical protein
MIETEQDQAWAEVPEDWPADRDGWPMEKKTVSPYRQGYLYRKGGGEDGPGVCQYHEGTPEYDDWYTGFYDADDNEPMRKP